MNKRIAISALTVSVLIFIIYGFYLYNLPHLGVLNQKAALNVTSVDLYNDFSKSESAANFKYLNKVILVNGEVSEIKHLNNSFMVELLPEIIKKQLIVYYPIRILPISG